jgi:hypothetical protein
MDTGNKLPKLSADTMANLIKALASKRPKGKSSAELLRLLTVLLDDKMWQCPLPWSFHAALIGNGGQLQTADNRIVATLPNEELADLLIQCAEVRQSQL